MKRISLQTVNLNLNKPVSADDKEINLMRLLKHRILTKRIIRNIFQLSAETETDFAAAQPDQGIG